MKEYGLYDLFFHFVNQGVRGRLPSLHPDVFVETTSHRMVAHGEQAILVIYPLPNGLWRWELECGKSKLVLLLTLDELTQLFVSGEFTL